MANGGLVVPVRPACHSIPPHASKLFACRAHEQLAWPDKSLGTPELAQLCVDHSTVHHWVVRFSPQPLERFNRSKRTVTGRWHLDETYVKVRGQWMYLYRAIDSVGDTVEFFFSEHRDLAAARRFLRKALHRHGRPERIVIDGSQTNRDAIRAG